MVEDSPLRLLRNILSLCVYLCVCARVRHEVMNFWCVGFCIFMCCEDYVRGMPNVCPRDIYMCVYMRAYMHIYVFICICMYDTYIHTYTRSRLQPRRL